MTTSHEDIEAYLYIRDHVGEEAAKSLGGNPGLIAIAKAYPILVQIASGHPDWELNAKLLCLTTRLAELNERYGYDFEGPAYKINDLLRFEVIHPSSSEYPEYCEAIEFWLLPPCSESGYEQDYWSIEILGYFNKTGIGRPDYVNPIEECTELYQTWTADGLVSEMN